MKEGDPSRFTAFQRPVLCFLAISREPVTITQLGIWTGLEPGDIAQVIRDWRQFLNEDATTYRIYHRSFAEFLDEQENLRYYHDQIASAALAKIPGLSSGHPDTQTPRHPDTQTPRHPDTQTPRHPDTQTPRHPWRRGQPRPQVRTLAPAASTSLVRDAAA